MTHRAVVALDVRRLLQLRQNVLRENLAELDAHLVCCTSSANAHICTRPPKEARTERVDAPNDALREDLVLVERDERAEGRGREQREEDAVARPVALENLALHERLARSRAHLL